MALPVAVLLLTSIMGQEVFASHAGADAVAAFITSMALAVLAFTPDYVALAGGRAQIGAA